MKLVKVALLWLAKQIGLFEHARQQSSDRVRILCYHGTLMTERFRENSMFFHPATFDGRMKLLIGLGYHVIPLSEAVEALAGRRPVAPNSVVITIDDGWYSTYATMWPTLRRLALPATLYVDSGNLASMRPVANNVSNYIWATRDVTSFDPECKALLERASDRDLDTDLRMTALREVCARIDFEMDDLLRQRVFDYMTVDELRTVAAEGLAIELHSHNHTIGDHSPAAVGSEIAANRQALGEILGREPASFRHFCYPSGACSEMAARSVAACDIDSSTTTENRLAARGDDLQLLPRLLDTPAWSDLEFEAELCGFSDMVRPWRRWFASLPQTAKAAYARLEKSPVA